MFPNFVAFSSCIHLGKIPIENTLKGVLLSKNENKKKKHARFPGQTFCFILSKPIRSLNYLLSHSVTALSCTVKARQHSREKSLVLFYAAATIDYKLTVASGFLSHLKLACSYQLIVLKRCWFALEYSVQRKKKQKKTHSDWSFSSMDVRIHTWNLG